MIALLLAGLAMLVAGGALSAAPRFLRTGLVVQASGMGLVGIAGGWAVVADDPAGASFTGALDPSFGVDGLSGFFLATLGVVAVPTLGYAVGYLRPGIRGSATAALTAAFLVVLVAVLCARDPLGFLIAWELMTLLPAAIILVGRSDRAARQTVFVYVAITHLAGVGVWLAVLLLADAGALDGVPLTEGSGLQAVVAIAAIIGFGTKAGLAPFHVWLPRAHPIAPAPVSALMSGVMIKVALYGLVRVLTEWLGDPPGWLGVTLLGLGALSAVGGVLYALFQHELKRLLAFHSIENIGIIVLGLGACLVLRARGEEAWAAFALAAALLHTLNHAIFKALLFLGAGSFERAVGSLDLDQLGGLLRRMPWTGGAFLVGATAIAGLPPLNGFASEWLTLQALLRVPAYGSVTAGIAGALALAALAATAALAVFCFVKVVGLVLLGEPTRPSCAAAQEVPVTMRAATAVLAAGCVLLGVMPGLVFGQLVGLAPWSESEPTAVGLDVPTTGGLPTMGIALILAGVALTLALLRGSRRAEPAPTWASGQHVGPELTWTAAGFTKTVGLMLGSVLRPERDLTVEITDGVTQRVTYTGRMPQLVDERVYRPVTRRMLEAAMIARRLQSGRLGTYVAYLIALVLVLLLAVETGVLG